MGEGGGGVNPGVRVGRWSVAVELLLCTTNVAPGLSIPGFATARLERQKMSDIYIKLYDIYIYIVI